MIESICEKTKKKRMHVVGSTQISDVTPLQGRKYFDFLWWRENYRTQEIETHALDSIKCGLK